MSWERIDELTARNLGLIATAAIDLDPGLTVITGETGAGKTLMLGALRLLRGEKASRGSIGPHGGDSEVAARLVSGSDGEMVIRRRLDGKRSRAYIDDAAVSVGALAEAVGGGVAIVGQHDQHTITSTGGVRRIIDACLDDVGIDTRRAYADAWAAHQRIVAEIETIGSDPRALERERDMLAFQVAEITEAGLDPDDEHDVRAELARLRNAEALATDLMDAMTALGDEGAGALLDRSIRALSSAASLEPSLDGLAERATALGEEITALSGEVAVVATDTEPDPERLAASEDRMALINALKRKYGDSIVDILHFAEEASEREAELTHLLDAAADIEERRIAVWAGLVAAGADLRSARTDAASGIAERARLHLQDLGFTEPVIAVDIDEADPASEGADRCTIRFASSGSLTPGPVASVASGGELSRIVLALTLASGAVDTALVAFDEIDAGVGGITALAMGEKLAELAADRQVVCVTHLPQVAAFAGTHFVVRRDGDRAEIERVAPRDRAREITRMLAGLSESERGREHAEELLELASTRR